MQQILKSIIKTVVISALFCSQYAAATECYSLSPNLGDDYYNLKDTATLSNAQKKTLRSFFRNLGGKWQGSMSHIECRGPDRAPKIITKSAKLSSKNKFDSQGKLLINIEKYFTKQRIKKQESLNLLGKRNVFDFEIEGGQHFTFSERYRRQNNIKPKIDKTKPSSNNQTIIDKTSNDSTKQVVSSYNKEKRKKTSRFIETIYDIQLNGNQLSISRAYYTNGVYTGEEVWRLRPN